MAYRSDGRSFRITAEARQAVEKIMAESGMSFSAAVNNALTTTYGEKPLIYYTSASSATSGNPAAAVSYVTIRSVEPTFTSAPTWPPVRTKKG